jgi:hypothetical protein
MARAKKQLDSAVVAGDVVSILIQGDQCTVTFLVDSDYGSNGSITEDVPVTLSPAQVTRVGKVVTSALKTINKQA